MKKVLIDNWSIEEFVSQVEFKSTEDYDSKFFGILEAILLWDEIYYPQNNKSIVWKESASRIAELKCLDNILKPLEIHPDNNTTDLFLKLFPDMESVIVGQGAVWYSAESAKNGLDYYPCQRRAKYIEKTDLYKKIHNNSIRRNLIDQFNGEVRNIYDEYMNYYPGLQVEYDFPYIADYLLKKSEGDPLRYTIERRKDSDIIELKQTFTRIEECISSGHIGEAIDYKKDIELIVKEIVDGRKLPTGSIGLLPSISIDFDVNNIVAGTRLTFLRKVAKNAIRG